MHIKAILIAACLLIVALMAVFASPPARAATYINNQLTEEKGGTTILGGGDHVFVRFGTDAAFGIVYGTTANPNNIYVVAIKARYLGVAQVVDSQGRTVLDNRAIKVYTLYAMKLDSIVEFRDLNGNSVADYARVYNSTTNKFSNYFGRGDTLYKKVDLNTNWTAGPIVQTNGTGYRTWTFDLSARNLTYSPIANYTGSVAGVLPLVHFTFHLNASLQQVTNVSVPQWKVTLSGANAVANVTRMTDLLVSGKAVHYDLKWDQDIEGWTFAVGNIAGNAPDSCLKLGRSSGTSSPRSSPISGWRITCWLVCAKQEPRSSMPRLAPRSRMRRPEPTARSGDSRPLTSTSAATGRGSDVTCGTATAWSTARIDRCSGRLSRDSASPQLVKTGTVSSASCFWPASASGAAHRSSTIRASRRTFRPIFSCRPRPLRVPLSSPWLAQSGSSRSCCSLRSS